jgi:hypothetical protein
MNRARFVPTTNPVARSYCPHHIPDQPSMSDMVDLLRAVMFAVTGERYFAGTVQLRRTGGTFAEARHTHRVYIGPKGGVTIMVAA